MAWLGWLRGGAGSGGLRDCHVVRVVIALEAGEDGGDVVGLLDVAPNAFTISIGLIDTERPRLQKPLNVARTTRTDTRVSATAAARNS